MNTTMCCIQGTTYVEIGYRLVTICTAISPQFSGTENRPCSRADPLEARISLRLSATESHNFGTGISFVVTSGTSEITLDVCPAIPMWALWA